MFRYIQTSLETNDFLLHVTEAQELLKRQPPEVLGNRLRRERIAQGISIRDLAQKASVGSNSIVRIENGQNFRATTLVQLCAALGLHLQRLADPDSHGVTAIHRESDNTWTTLDGYAELATNKPLEHSNLLVLLKSRLADGKLLPTIIEVREQSPTRSHPGEEFVYVIDGPVGIRVGGQSTLLQTGESMDFWGTEPHSYFPVNNHPGRILSVRVNP